MREVKIVIKPGASVVVEYGQCGNQPQAPFMVTGMHHWVAVGEGASTVTNMCHMIEHVMTSGLFTPLRVQIEHEIEMARRKRAIADHERDTRGL